MHLYEWPMIAVLGGLALYTILGGADFGAGLWQLVTLLPARRSPAGRERAEAIREHAHHAMGPVWEANHVWLIFVLTVTWTAYPTAFGAIAATMALPLLLAGIGVISRGAAYALRSGTSDARELGLIDGVFSLGSALAPFALGTIVGAIVSGQITLHNQGRNVFSVWLHPTSLLVGVLAVVLSAYMAAVYLAADAARHGEDELAAAFRRRALWAGGAAGVTALVGLPILHADAHRVFERLLTGPGLVGAIISLIGGAATIGLVVARRYEPARLSAAVAVAGLIIGWALAQRPVLLPGLSIAHAAASETTLVTLMAAIGMGAVILFPSLGLLFSLLLRGGFDEEIRPPSGAVGGTEISGSLSRGMSGRVAVAGLFGGVCFLALANPPWAHIVGIVCLTVCAGAGFHAVDPMELAEGGQEAGG